MEKLPASWRRGFAAAKAISLYSNGERLGERLGAALFSGSNLVSVGFNTYNKTHPGALSTIHHKRNVHAEHHAIIKRRHFDDTGSVMYVYRETVKGPAISKPCVSCIAIMRLANIKKVRFINSEGVPQEMKL